MDLWTETLEAKEYDALATMIANGVTTEIEVTTEQQSPLEGADSPSELEGEGRVGGAELGAEDGVRTLGVTRYTMDIQNIFHGKFKTEGQAEARFTRVVLNARCSLPSCHP